MLFGSSLRPFWGAGTLVILSFFLSCVCCLVLVLWSWVCFCEVCGVRFWAVWRLPLSFFISAFTQLLPHHHHQQQPHNLTTPSCLSSSLAFHHPSHYSILFLPVCRHIFFPLCPGSFLYFLSSVCPIKRQAGWGASSSHLLDILHHCTHFHIGSFTHFPPLLLRSSSSQAEGIFITETDAHYILTHTQREKEKELTTSERKHGLCRRCCSTKPTNPVVVLR